MRFVVCLLFGSAAAFMPRGATTLSGRRRAQMSMAALKEPLTDIAPLGPVVRIEGDTLKTWAFPDTSTERVQVSLTSEGRPIHTNVQLWQTPSYIPTHFKCYSEDGSTRPIHAVIETPIHPKTVAVYNTAQQDFPFSAVVADTGLGKAKDALAGEGFEKVQGGQITSYKFGAEVDSVQVLLQTVGLGERNMKAKIELTQGPNQIKQLIEVYASSGYKNPLYAVIQTPGADNTIRIHNQNTVEFPFDVCILPYETGSGDNLSPIMGN